MAKGIKIGIVVVCLAAAVFLLAKHFSKDSAAPEEGWQATIWHCPDCKTTFELTAAEYKSRVGKLSYVPCVSCEGVDAEEVYRCPHCDGYYPPFGHGLRGTHCPLCKEELPDLGASRLGGG